MLQSHTQLLRGLAAGAVIASNMTRVRQICSSAFFNTVICLHIRDSILDLASSHAKSIVVIVASKHGRTSGLAKSCSHDNTLFDIGRVGCVG